VPRDVSERPAEGDEPVAVGVVAAHPTTTIPAVTTAKTERKIPARSGFRMFAPPRTDTTAAT
jgi:hypothetical protein